MPTDDDILNFLISDIEMNSGNNLWLISLVAKLSDF